MSTKRSNHNERIEAIHRDGRLTDRQRREALDAERERYRAERAAAPNVSGDYSVEARTKVFVHRDGRRIPHTLTDDLTFDGSAVTKDLGHAWEIKVERDGRLWTLSIHTRDIKPARLAPVIDATARFEAKRAVADDSALYGTWDIFDCDALMDVMPIIPLAWNKLLVRSESDPDKAYTVTLGLDAQALGCECPDHAYRHRHCKHMRQAELAPAFFEAVDLAVSVGFEPTEIAIKIRGAEQRGKRLEGMVGTIEKALRVLSDHKVRQHGRAS